MPLLRQFRMPVLPCLLRAAGGVVCRNCMDTFRPPGTAYRPKETKAVLVQLIDIEPLRREKTSGDDGHGFDPERMKPIPKGASPTGSAIDAIPLVELPPLDPRLANSPKSFRCPGYSYRMRDGFHRFHASIELPASGVFRRSSRPFQNDSIGAEVWMERMNQLALIITASFDTPLVYEEELTHSLYLRRSDLMTEATFSHVPPLGVGSGAGVNEAQWMHERWSMDRRFRKESLTKQKRSGARLVNFGPKETISIDDVGFWGQDLVIFYGKNADGHSIRLLQHCTQVNVLLVAVPTKNDPPRRIGYILERDPGEKSENEMNQLAPITASYAPAPFVAAAGPRASYRFLEFFTAKIRNRPHAPRLHARGRGVFRLARGEGRDAA